jgi:hypothetical protein
MHSSKLFLKLAVVAGAALIALNASAAGQPAAANPPCNQNASVERLGDKSTDDKQVALAKEPKSNELSSSRTGVGHK